MRTRAAERQPSGFSLLELLAALAILLTISGVVMAWLVQMTLTQGTVSNRTEMHSSVRSATELLQQEIGQAGRVALPAPATLGAAVTVTGTNTVGINSTAGVAGMFTGELLLIDAGANQETITLTGVIPATNQITAIFNGTHAQGAPVAVVGAFSSGIVPTNMANGSSGTVLKIYGDINSDGNMVYVEYTCDTANGFLSRNVMPYDALAKVGANAQTLLTSVQLNPGGTACFTYQQKTVGGNTYVVDVAVTLTVQTQNPDPQTNQFQTETKALLNVSPRNVFEAWELASGGVTNRVQPIPLTVKNLLP